jgi:CubicO group peptidase (beta-lactamase class C family)
VKATVHSRCSAIALVCAVASTGCLFSRMFYYNIPNLQSAEYFDRRAVAPSATPLPFPRAAAEAKPRLTEHEKKTYGTFDAMLEKNLTHAFLVIKDDHIIYERYFRGTTAATPFPAFSMSKTVAALMVGCAIEDGLLGGPKESIVKFIPELGAKQGYEAVTIEHLLRMTSGINFTEESVPGAMFYYSQDLKSRLYQYDIKWKPGTHYEYASINTQLLWDALHRKLGGRTVSSYFAERLWTPLGAEHQATWSLDSAKGGVEKLFGGFNATMRDQARVGLVYLHGGKFGGKQVVPAKWIAESLEADEVAGIVDGSDGWVRRAKYQWFITLDGRAYFAKGYHGQYNFLVPSKNMVFMRFGEGYAEVDWPALFLRIAEES